MAIKIIDAGLRFNGNRTIRKGAVPGIVLHNAACDGSVEDIHRYHRDVNGWAGIGYHFYVRKNGLIYRGRPENWCGAHTVGHNEKIGICAEGNFDRENMSSVQKNAIVALLQYLLKRYGAVPIYGHRQLDRTSCPGKYYPFDEIVSEAKKPQTQTVATAVKNENLVKDFQKACIADGVSVGEAGTDNIWGPDTAAAARRLLKNGSVGERVRFVQHRLIALGYNLGKGGADGIFGEMTEKAVRAFQSKKALGVDGIVGIETIKALVEV